MYKTNIKSAFTMAEAILVMAILGVIATIMIATLKPAEFKDRAMKTLSKKVLQEIDQATTLIQANDSVDGTFFNLYTSTGTKFGINQSAKNSTYAGYLKDLYKKYLVLTYDECGSTCSCQKFHMGTPSSTGAIFFYLKNGACVGIQPAKQTNMPILFPGKTTVKYAATVAGAISFDINGDAEPNIMGKDRFIVPLGKEGIQYDVTLTDGES